MKGIADEALALRIDDEIELLQRNVSNPREAFVRQRATSSGASRPKSVNFTRP